MSLKSQSSRGCAALDIRSFVFCEDETTDSVLNGRAEAGPLEGDGEGFLYYQGEIKFRIWEQILNLYEAVSSELKPFWVQDQCCHCPPTCLSVSFSQPPGLSQAGSLGSGIWN